MAIGADAGTRGDAGMAGAGGGASIAGGAGTVGLGAGASTAGRKSEGETTEEWATGVLIRLGGVETTSYHK